MGSVETGSVKLDNYKIVDLILGKQKLTITGNGNTGLRYFTFPKKLQEELTKFTSNGGDLLVSGQYILSDLYDSRSTEGSRDFAKKVLGITRGEGAISYSGRLSTKSGAMGSKVSGQGLSYSNTLNEKQYIVENPDLIIPSGDIDADIFMTFADTGNAAGIFTKRGKSRGAVMSIPILFRKTFH